MVSQNRGTTKYLDSLLNLRIKVLWTPWCATPLLSNFLLFYAFFGKNIFQISRRTPLSWRIKLWGILDTPLLKVIRVEDKHSPFSYLDPTMTWCRLNVLQPGVMEVELYGVLSHMMRGGEQALITGLSAQVTRDACWLYAQHHKLCHINYSTHHLLALVPINLRSNCLRHYFMSNWYR